MKQGWINKRIEDIILKCKNIKWNEVPKERDFFYIDLASVSRDNKSIENPQTINSSNAPSRAKQIINGGDVLFGTTRPTLKRYCVVDDIYNNQICSTGFCVLRPRVDEILSKFLFYLLSTEDFYDYIEPLQNGTSYPAVTDNIVKNYSTRIPSLSEQQRIVDLLDAEFAKIDALKANAEQQLQAAKDLFQSALTDIFTPKVGWEMKTLGDVGDFMRGGNFKKSDFVEDGIPCVHYGQIHMHFGVSTKAPLSYLPKDFPKVKYARMGDLLIAITSEDDEGSCKCTAWMGKEDVAIGGHSAIYRHELDPVFMSYYFRTPFFQKEKLNYTHGFKVVEIKPSDIGKIHISYPKDKQEQQQIVARLDAISERVKALQTNYNQTITLCNDLKQALLKSIFE